MNQCAVGALLAAAGNAVEPAGAGAEVAAAGNGSTVVESAGRCASPPLRNSPLATW
jgi:hypothetical protein